MGGKECLASSSDSGSKQSHLNHAEQRNRKRSYWGNPLIIPEEGLWPRCCKELLRQFELPLSISPNQKDAHFQWTQKVMSKQSNRGIEGPCLSLGNANPSNKQQQPSTTSKPTSKWRINSKMSSTYWVISFTFNTPSRTWFIRTMTESPANVETARSDLADSFLATRELTTWQP